MTAANALPEAFVRFHELVKSHLKQILKLDAKPPMHAVALLTMVAHEALSMMLSQGSGQEFFARDLKHRRGVKLPIGRALFRSLRHGLAHQYEPSSITIEGWGALRPVLVWKQGHHLDLAGGDMINGRLCLRELRSGDAPRLVVDVEALRNDLELRFAETDAWLMNDPAMRDRVTLRASSLREETEEVEGTAAAAWRDFLAERGWSVSP